MYIIHTCIYIYQATRSDSAWPLPPTWIVVRPLVQKSNRLGRSLGQTTKPWHLVGQASQLPRKGLAEREKYALCRPHCHTSHPRQGADEMAWRHRLRQESSISAGTLQAKFRCKSALKLSFCIKRFSLEGRLVVSPTGLLCCGGLAVCRL